MARRIITVARSLGAGGEEVGRLVAKELGFRYVDDEIISKAAEKAGVSPDTVAQAERTEPLIMRVLDAMGHFPADPLVGPVVTFAADPSLRSPAYDELIEEVVRETAARGNVVIVAHGAGMHLAGTDGLLRVFVTGLAAARAERLRREAKLDERRARKAIQESDRQRRQYLRRFCEVAQESPTHYDLVINTDVLTAQQAANLIVAASRL
ncbi:MAG: cytidylate kinase-like family protein [Chloroflexi bacterium]|nr:cytidylate kinase-like family protein [Chloroflexota bacterium]